jgi:NodT family efflux transporter outer membrane factor (OMF) lipoprotein
MRARALLAAGVSLLAAACAVGPNYQRPDAPVSPAYKEPVPAPTPGAVVASEWKPAQPADAANRETWWEVYGDPDLNALEEKVSVSNQNLALADAQFRGARAVARGARAELFPTLSVSPSVTRSHSLSRNSALPGAPAGTATTYQLAGDVSYEFDVWGRIRRNVESRVEAAQASAADLEVARLSLHAELAADYFLLRGADAQARILRTNVDAYEKARQLTVDRHAQGVVSGVDVAQAETQLESTRAQLTEIELSRAQLEHAIAILTGQPPALLTIAPTDTETLPVVVPPDLPSTLLERRPDIAAAERRVASANAGIGVAQAAFFPQFLLNATGGWEGNSVTKWFSAPNLFWSLGVALAQTIFDGGARIAGKEQAIAAWDASVASYRESVLEAFQDVEDQLAALSLLSRESDEQARALDAAQRALVLADNRYKGGVTSYLEVVVAQAVALNNERAAVDLKTRQLVANVSLIKALGGGWTAAEIPEPRAVLASVPSAAEVPPGSDSPPPPPRP